MKPPSFAVKSLLSILAGTLLSRLLYPLTHGDRRALPELYGIGFGCLLIAAVHYWLYRDDIETARVFYSMALVGLGVAGNRALLELFA